MPGLKLEDVGLDQAELQERIIERAASKLAGEVATNEHALREFRSTIEEAVGEMVSRIVEEETKPWVEGRIEGVVMQRTNEWGEAKGEPVTFREYLIERADAYMQEPVNYEGKSRKEDRFGGSFRSAGTRITYMVDQHLQYSIKSAMEAALKDANSKIVGGIAEAVKIKLAEVQSALKVDVKTR